MTKRDLFCLTNEELNNFKYPNLIAEVRETTYSICTIANHMELSKPYRKEDDAETWDKLTGNRDILYSEAFGLCALFGVTFEYLFDEKLKIVSGKPAAYWRWFDKHKKPCLLEFMKIAVTLNDEQIDVLVNELRKRKNCGK